MSALAHQALLASYDRGLKAKAGSFNTGTDAVSATVAITGLGFKPKAIIFLWTGQTGTVDAVAGADAKFGIGLATGASNRNFICQWSDDGAGTSVENACLFNNACVGIMSGDGTMDGTLDVQSFDEDGFTLVVDDQFSASYRVQYLALGGPELSAKTNVVTITTGTGNKDFTDPGFDPTGLILTNIGSQYVNVFNAWNIFMVGAYDGTTQGVIAGRSQDAVSTSNTNTYNRQGDEILAYGSTVNSIDRRGIASFITNGFRINMTNAVGANIQVPYLAVSGCKFKVGELLTRTDGSDIAVTGLGFAPKAVFFFSNGQTESVALTQGNNQKMMFGAASSPSDRVAASYYNRDNLADSQVVLAIEHDAVYANVGNSDTIDGLMDLVSMDAGGFTCVMDDFDPSAAMVQYIAIG